MFWATTALQEFWGEASPEAFLGKWCTGVESCQDFPGTVLVHPWQRLDELQAARAAADGLYEELLSDFAAALNQIHRCNHGIRYWRIILGPWLWAFVHIVSERHACLSSALEKDSGFRTIGLARESRFVPQGFQELFISSYDDLYNLQIYSELLDLMGVDVPRSTASAQPLVIQTRTPGTASSLAAMRRAVGDAIDRWLLKLDRKRVIAFDLPPMERGDRFRLFQRSGAKILVGLRTPRLNHWDAAFHAKTRAELQGRLLGECQDAGSVEWAIRTLVAHHLPPLYLERFSEFCLALEPLVSLRPAVIAAGYGWMSNEAAKFLGAACAEEGSKLVGIQHGGGYGVQSYFPPEIHERSVSDYYLTWGWGDGAAKLENSPTLPLPVPRFSGSKRQKRGPEQGTVLFVSYEFPRYHSWLYEFPSWIAPKYWDDQRTFFSTCTREVLARIDYRHHGFRWEKTWQPFHDLNRHAVMDRFPPPNGEPPPMSEALAAASIVVTNMRWTAYLESLALNKPTILFWRDELNPIQAGVANDFNLLRSAGILYDSPAAAARHLQGVIENPEKWWKSERVQKNRAAFVKRHARTSDNWAEEWTGTFSRLLQ